MAARRRRTPSLHVHRPINAGDNSLSTDDGTASGVALTVDQRGAGYERIIAGTVDLGAQEAHYITVTTTVDEDDGTDDPGTGSGTSLREAIDAANAAPGPTLIVFSATDAGGAVNFHDQTPDVITLNGTQLEISSDITIAGPGADLLTISGNDASRVFEIASGDHDVTMDFLSINDGYEDGSDGNGGAIRNFSSGIVELQNVQLSENRAAAVESQVSPEIFVHEAHGGAISHSNGTLAISNSRITGNIALGSQRNSAGAIIAESGIVQLVDTSVRGNQSHEGGAVFVTGNAFLSVLRSTIAGNRALHGVDGDGAEIKGQGGAIYNQGELTAINSTVSGNRAAFGGGSIFNEGGSSTILIHSTVTLNTTDSAGVAGIESSSGLTLQNTIVAGNLASGSAS